MLKLEELPQWAKEPILARRAATTWLAKRPVRHPDSKGKSLHKVDGLIEIQYIFEENADEHPEIRVSVKDEGLIGKKMLEAMLAKGNSVKDEGKIRKKMKEAMLAKGKIDCVGKGEVVCTEHDEWWFGGQKGGVEE